MEDITLPLQQSSIVFDISIISIPDHLDVEEDKINVLFNKLTSDVSSVRS